MGGVGSGLNMQEVLAQRNKLRKVDKDPCDSVGVYECGRVYTSGRVGACVESVRLACSVRGRVYVLTHLLACARARVQSKKTEEDGAMNVKGLIKHGLQNIRK